MRKVLAVLAFAALASTASADFGYAEVTYPWCAHYGGRDSGRNCGFSTWEQCRAAISGNGGYCMENPMYQPVFPDASRKPRRR